MKVLFLVGILLVYFPVLYFSKKKIIRTMGEEKIPAHLSWYDGAGYLINHSTDSTKREKLIRLQSRIRTAGITGIIMFWVVVLLL
jgi:hypothetical protein